MRNNPHLLSASDVRNQKRIMARLMQVHTSPIAVSYIRRDGLPSSSHGIVKGYCGKPGYDTGSVVIDDMDKGPRTINLHRIYAVSTI